MVHRKARGFGGDNDLPAKSCGANGGSGSSSGGFGSGGSSSSSSARGGGVEGPTSNNGFINNSGSKGGRSNGGGGDDPDEDMDLDQFQCPDSPTQSWLAENADLSPLQVLDNISLKSGRI